MQITIAPFSGFCFGVKRAINEGEKQLKITSSPIASLGPLIHNPPEVQRLEKLGIICRENLNDIKEDKVLVRTHGITSKLYEKLKDQGYEIIDCTCPFVRKVQKIANEYGNKGYKVLILGNENHPEVEGIIGWSKGQGVAFKEISQLEAMKLETEKVCLVAQTTEKEDNLTFASEYLKKRVKNLVIFNTICSATSQRQKSALDLAKKVDLMIVVGGLNSANTQKLAQICHEAGATTKHIESAQELVVSWFHGVNSVGVTAGASTPDWIIEEVVKKMEEITKTNNQTEGNDIQDQMDHDMVNMGEFKPGDIVTGKVVKINNDEVLVDVGGKSEGIIPLNEISYRKVENPADFVKVGDEVSVVVLKVENDEGNMILSKRRAEQEKALEVLENAFTNGTVIEAEVIEVVKGGILVDVGMRGFVPASLLDRGYVENLEQFVGQTLRLKVIEFEKEAKKAVLSRKAVLEEEYEANKAKILSEIEEGQTRKGVVQRITDFGAFIDLGGIDGLLHVSEMGWGRVNHPHDVVKEGDELEVYILSVDKENERISLSLKQLVPSPWEAAAQKYPAGTIIEGKVARIAPFGTFVEIEPGIDGLVHISQMSWERVEKAEDVVNIGDTVKVKVLDVDPQAKKMSLSIKEATEKPVKEKKEPEKHSYVPQSQDNEPSGTTIGDIVGDIFKDLKTK